MGGNSPGVPAKSPDLVFRQVDEESILVPIRQDAADLQYILTTNEVGSRIWELIDGNRSVKEIAATIAQEYEVSSDEAQADTIAFVDQLHDANCVTWSAN